MLNAKHLITAFIDLQQFDAFNDCESMNDVDILDADEADQIMCVEADAVLVFDTAAFDYFSPSSRVAEIADKYRSEFIDYMAGHGFACEDISDWAMAVRLAQ